MEDIKKIFIVDYESIRGVEIHRGFFDETLAQKFTEAINCGNIREVEICESIPDKFMFYVMFESGEVLESGLWSNANLNDCINIVTPVRVSVIIEEASVKEAEKTARQKAINFIKGRKDGLMMDVTYRMSDGTVVQPSSYPTQMPMIPQMREQALALLEGRLDDALIHSVETVLLFWASPSSEDGIYRFKMCDKPEQSRLSMSIPAVRTSSSKIELRRQDKDEFLEIAKNLGFEQVESTHPDVLCLKRQF